MVMFSCARSGENISPWDTGLDTSRLLSVAGCRSEEPRADCEFKVRERTQTAPCHVQFCTCSRGKYTGTRESLLKRSIRQVLHGFERQPQGSGKAVSPCVDLASLFGHLTEQSHRLHSQVFSPTWAYYSESPSVHKGSTCRNVVFALDILRQASLLRFLEKTGVE
ncbi:hypothetical protein BU26DRAFT_121945 [Trematosphaeria pertusa]|uniref:Uncharacterized protein n=1 Tax=Trematosphaeria pertusa TaxID=390896 RepID=A0A6A6HY43_9PLEO|nr:uncharacterized protein BU26DRAFT_121945 [Trematosphaeria pertusa]KAF2242937.1 hypothetical protein BU26DRAFT_121945 [Trematosphaeria pertusa]